MRGALLILPVLLTAFVLAACGGSETTAPQPPPKIDVAQATARTADAESARFSLSGEGGRGGPFTGEGELAGNRGKLELHFSEAAGGLFPADVEAVFADGALYLRLSGLAGLLPGLVSGGKDWLRVDLAADSDVLDEYLDFGGGDPTRLLETLEAAGAFAEVGSERVRGVETTRYRGSVASSRVDVWVGADELVRRVTVHDGDGTNVELELYDFGADVEVERPPDDEVAELGDLLQGGF
ncbi:MAG: hypothetical protein ACRDNR_12260 [Gaiellaceae bacterium]